jgi:hypothetical protein
MPRKPIQVVTVGSHGGHRTSDILLADLAQRRSEIAVPAGADDQVDRAPGPGQPVVGVRDERCELGGELGARRCELGPALGELQVPDVEGGGDLRTETSAGLLEERVALAEHPLDVGPQPFVPRVELDQQIVEQSTAPPGPALHQLQVVRREHHHAQVTEHVACPRHAFAIQLETGPTTDR